MREFALFSRAIIHGAVMVVVKMRSDCDTLFCDRHHAGAKLKAKTNCAVIFFGNII